MLPVLRNSKRNENANAWLPSIFDDFFGDEFMGFPVNRQFATPAVNIIEQDKQFDIQIAARGMTKDDFKISINDNNELAIHLEKKTEDGKKDEKKGTWLRREFSYASYSQSFTIPDEVEEEKITARMENGVLNIQLPKREQVVIEPKVRQIEVQ